VYFCGEEQTRKTHERGPEASFLSLRNWGRGRSNPCHVLIRAEDIRALAEEHLQGTPGFLVDVTVSDGSNIRVLVDHDESTSIEFCMGLSRHIESSLDRDVQDFSLDVSSPGLDQPLKLHRQYVKNVGREVAVMPVQGAKMEGVLTAVEYDHFVVTTREKRRIEGRKAKEWVEEQHPFPFADVHWTKVVISFNNNPRA